MAHTLMTDRKLVTSCLCVASLYAGGVQAPQLTTVIGAVSSSQLLCVKNKEEFVVLASETADRSS